MSLRRRVVEHLLLLLAGWVGLPPPAVSWAANENIPFTWQGTITLHQTELMAPANGNVVTRWDLRPKWREGRRIDVRDDKGALTGQFVRLEEEGSSWSGSTSGSVAGSCSKNTTYVGSGRGGGDVITPGWGWIYFSMSDDDPLRAVLPSGFYVLSSNMGSTARYVIHIENTNNCNTPARSHGMEMPAMLGFKINGAFYYEPFGAPGGSSPESLRASDVLAILNAGAGAGLPRGWDTQARVLDDKGMSGSYAITWLEKIKRQGSWKIERILDIHPRLQSPDRNWRPKGGAEENSVSITARIADYPDLPGKWRFTLVDVSREQGYCLNKGEGTELDLRFEDGQAGFSAAKKTADGWIIETDHSANSATVVVRSLDYGAWGRIKAEVNVDDHWYEAVSDQGQDTVTIPLDDNTNHIADGWEQDNGVLGEAADADNDAEPKPVGELREPGDGFSNYEEYRGFVVQGAWLSTDPRHKDIFIYDAVGYGVGLFVTTGLAIHDIAQDEYDDNRVVNRNRGHGTLTTQSGQKGLHLLEKDMGSFRSGSGTGGKVSAVGTPNVVKEVAINSQKINYAERESSSESFRNYLESIDGLSAGYINDKVAEWERGHPQAGDSAQENLKAEGGENLRSLHETIAHELGHAVNIPHHGTLAIQFREFDLEWVGGGAVALPGGKWSGDVLCVMRYDCADKYRDGEGREQPYPCPAATATPPAGFCKDRAGTGVNAGGQVAGDATEGECLRRLTLKGSFRDGN